MVWTALCCSEISLSYKIWFPAESLLYQNLYFCFFLLFPIFLLQKTKTLKVLAFVTTEILPHFFLLLWQFFYLFRWYFADYRFLPYLSLHPLIRYSPAPAPFLFLVVFIVRFILLLFHSIYSCLDFKPGKWNIQKFFNFKSWGLFIIFYFCFFLLQVLAHKVVPTTPGSK